jgi:hypothetical protein
MGISTKREREGVYRVLLSGKPTSMTVERNDGAEVSIRWQGLEDGDLSPKVEGATKKYVLERLAAKLGK